MILIATPSPRADDCVHALRVATNEEVVVADSLRVAAVRFRTEIYSAVVLDQYLLETEPDEARTLIERLGTAIPVHINFAICGMERLIREVRAAIQRSRREKAAARQAVLNSLHGELNGTVTALLLSCEMALGTPGLPPEAVERMQCARGLVKTLCSQLESVSALD